MGVLTRITQRQVSHLEDYDPMYAYRKRDEPKQRSGFPGLHQIEQPQKSLVPVGGSGFWVTPGSPAKPSDCDRWKTAPGCGGLPFSKLPFGLGVDVVKGGNFVGVQISPTFAFINLPEFQFGYGNPNSLPPVDHTSQRKPPVYPSTQTSVQGLPSGIDSETMIYCALIGNYTTKFSESRRLCGSDAIVRNVNQNPVDYSDPVVTRDSTDRVIGLSAIRYTSVSVAEPPAVVDQGNNCIVTPAGRVQVPEPDKQINYPISAGIQYVCNANGQIYSYYSPSQGRLVEVGITRVNPQFSIYNSEIPYGSAYALMDSRPMGIYYGKWKDLVTHFSWKWTNSITQEAYLEIGWLIAERGKPLKADPPSLPPERCCPMSCCKGSEDSEYLLRQILEECKKANKAIGSDEFPFNLPNDMSDEGAGERSIPNLATGISHHVNIIDTISGEYPIEIEIEDSTYLEEGNQKLNLKFPNQAEMLAEIFGILYQAKVSGEAALSASMRALAESGAIRNTVTQEWFLTLAIVEFLGFELAQEKTEMKYAFNPEGTDLEKVLREGKSKLSTFKWKGGKDLHDHLAVYNFASQIVKGALFQPTGSAAETKAKIKEILKEDPKDSGNNDLEFDDFVRLVENGWGTVPGIDTKVQTRPYQRDREYRPNIKELGVDGDTQAEAESD